MTVEQYDPNQRDNLITVSPPARAYFLKQLAKKEDHSRGVRLSITSTGCSGYQYALEWTKQTAATDIPIPLDDDHVLLIDSAVKEMLRGTEIILKKEGLNETIEFKNPNATATCGCGESFSVTPTQSQK